MGIDNVPSWQGDWGAVLEPAAAVFVLPPGAFLEPAGVALLAAVIARRGSLGKSTSFLPRDPAGDAFRYLQRIDFFRALGIELPEAFRRRESAGRFVPLRRIVDLGIAQVLATETGAFLETNLPTAPPSVLRGIRFILEELGANIVQHSGRPETGFGLAQAFPQAGRIQFAYCDCGVGFLKSLQRNAELAGRVQDDGEAIQLAVEKGLSGVSGRANMGVGLAHLRELSDGLGADLRVLSGSGYWYRRTVVASKRVSFVRSVASFPGSWICLDAPVVPS